MARFEELQELWQNQPSRTPAAFDARGLAEELRRFGRQQNWINGVKVLLLVCVFWRMPARVHWTPVALCGTLLTMAGVVVYLVLDWRNQIGLSRLDFSAPSVEFVRDARTRLQHQLNPMRRAFWLLVVTVGGGLNLLLLAHPAPLLSVRIARHLSATAVPFAAYVVGQKIREFRFKRECGAVLEKLEALLQALEEKS
jgi:hypothetical protein